MTYAELRALELQLIREKVDPGIAEAILEKATATSTSATDQLRPREIGRRQASSPVRGRSR